MSDDIETRPEDSNADAWHLFLSQYLDNRANFPNGMTFMAVQIAEAIDAAAVDRDSLRKALDDRHAADKKAWSAIMRATGKERGLPDNKEVVAFYVAEVERLEKENYFLKRLREATDAKPDFEKLWEEASNDADSLRAKLDEIEHALTECGMPAQLGNPPEPWPARDRILGAYADYLKRHNEACKIDMENWSLRAKLDRATGALGKLRNAVFELCEDTEDKCANEAGELEGKMGAFARGRIREAKSIRKTIAEISRELISELSADAPAQQTQISDEDGR